MYIDKPILHHWSLYGLAEKIYILSFTHSMFYAGDKELMTKHQNVRVISNSGHK